MALRKGEGLNMGKTKFEKMSKTETWWIMHWVTFPNTIRVDGEQPPVWDYTKRDFNAIKKLDEKGIVNITRSEEKATPRGGLATYFKINIAELRNLVNQHWQQHYNVGERLSANWPND